MLRVVLLVSLSKVVSGGNPIRDRDPDLQVRYNWHTKVKGRFYTLRERFYNYKYNPNDGYQPYWKDGEHYIVDPWLDMSDKGITTEAVQQVCGEDCNTSYRNIMDVCVHHTGTNRIYGCWPPMIWGYCGQTLDEFYYPFIQFPTYCKYLATACKAKISGDRLVLMHVGACVDYTQWLKPIETGWDAWERLKGYSLYITVEEPSEVPKTTTTKKPKKG